MGPEASSPGKHDLICEPEPCFSSKLKVDDTAIGFAVVAFYFLDFSLNALQASLRNLLLDVTPPSQLNSGNAWHGRMTHAGNIVGYGFGE